MIRFAVVQHTYSEFLGLIEQQLERRNIAFYYFRPFIGQALPAPGVAVGQYDALFLLGGKVPLTDRAAVPWLDEELALIERFRRAGRPIVGIGFGGLLVAVAAGAVPLAEPRFRAVWTIGRATAVGRDDPLAQAVDGRALPVLVSGGAQLPAGLTPIVVDEAGDWLAIRPDPYTYGLLFRPEIKPGIIEDMIMEAGREMPEEIDGLLAQARAQWSVWQQTAERVLVALVEALDLMTERRKPSIIPIEVLDR